MGKFVWIENGSAVKEAGRRMILPGEIKTSGNKEIFVEERLRYIRGKKGCSYV